MGWSTWVRGLEYLGKGLEYLGKGGWRMAVQGALRMVISTQYQGYGEYKMEYED